MPCHIFLLCSPFHWAHFFIGFNTCSKIQNTYICFWLSLFFNSWNQISLEPVGKYCSPEILIRCLFTYFLFDNKENGGLSLEPVGFFCRIPWWWGQGLTSSISHSNWNQDDSCFSLFFPLGLSAPSPTNPFNVDQPKPTLNQMRTNSPVPSVPVGMPMNSMTYSASLPLPLSSIPSTMTLPASVSAFPQAGAGPFPELPSNLPQPLLPLSGSIPPPLASQSGMNPFLWEDLIGDVWCIPYFFPNCYGGSPVQSTFVLKQASPWKFWSKRLSMTLLARWDTVQKKLKTLTVTLNIVYSLLMVAVGTSADIVWTD